MEDKRLIKARKVAKIFFIISAAVGFPTIILFVFSLIGLNYLAEIEAKERKRSLAWAIVFTIFANIVSGIILIIDYSKNKNAEVLEMSENLQKVQKDRRRVLIKKTFNVLSYAFLGLLVVVDIFALTSKLAMKNEKGGLPLFNKEARIVLTGSMDNQNEDFYEKGEGKDYEIKRIPVHSMVFLEKVPLKDKEANKKFFANIKVNDVLTFNYKLGGQFYVVTHRVININASNPNSIEFTLRGDNPEGDSVVSKYSPTQKVRSDSGYIIGKVVGQNEVLGHISYAFHKPLVLVFIVIVPSAILMFYELGNIVFTIYADKKERAHEEFKKNVSAQEEELQRLKRDLEMLRKERGAEKEKRDE